MSIEQYLEELRDPLRPLLASRLSELSSLLPEEAPLLSQAWPQIAVARRRQILRRLLDLAEDNVEMDFDAVFMVALKDDDAEARALAVQGLWEHEGRDVIAPLIEILRRDPSATVRAQAATSLGSFVLRAEFQRLSATDSRRIEDALRATVDDPGESPEVRARALESIGALSTSWVRATIESAYRSNDWRLRVSAVHAMGRNCDPTGCPSSRKSLLATSRRCDMKRLPPARPAAMNRPCPSSKPLLEDEDAEVQEAAIAALGEIGGGEARRALAEIDDHPEPRVREAVAAALEEIEFNQDALGFHLP